MKQDSGQPGLTKSPQALSLHDVQQPPTLGNVFKRFSVSSLTNACCRNTQSKTKSSERKASGWRDGWMMLGIAERELQRALSPTKGGHHGQGSAERAAILSQPKSHCCSYAPCFPVSLEAHEYLIERD